MKFRFFILIFLVFTMSISWPVESQAANDWTILPDNTLYYVGEKISVVVLGPPNSFFFLNINSCDENSTNIMSYAETTGPDGNATVIFRIYEDLYDSGNYILNITYYDSIVAAKQINIVRDENEIMQQEIDQNAENINNNRGDILAFSEIVQYFMSLIKWVILPCAIIGFFMSMLCFCIVLVRVVLPQQRYYNQQWNNSASASSQLAKKIDMDIPAVHGVHHPDLGKSEYRRIIEISRELGLTDNYIDTMIQLETGNFAPTVKAIPWGKVGPYMILKHSRIGRNLMVDHKKDESKKDRAIAKDMKNKMKHAAKVNKILNKNRKSLLKDLEDGKITKKEYDAKMIDLDSEDIGCELDES